VCVEPPVKVDGDQERLKRQQELTDLNRCFVTAPPISIPEEVACDLLCGI